MVSSMKPGDKLDAPEVELDLAHPRQDLLRRLGHGALVLLDRTKVEDVVNQYILVRRLAEPLERVEEGCCAS